MANFKFRPEFTCPGCYCQYAATSGVFNPHYTCRDCGSTWACMVGPALLLTSWLKERWRKHILQQDIHRV